MTRVTTLWISGIVVACITVLSMSMKHSDKRSPAIAAIGQLYKSDMQRLDSFLAQYPKYFYDSSYVVRRAKYDELTWRIKRVEGIFAYLHPAKAYETFLKPPQFDPHESGPPFPDNWLIGGPFGIERDSTVRKMKGEDSLFTIQFIDRGVRSFRKVIQQTDLYADISTLSETDVFECLRLEMIRISTVGLANGDFVVDQAGLPALRGAFSAWADNVLHLAEQLPQNQRKLKNEFTQKLSSGQKLLDQQKDLVSLDHMHFLTEYLLPLSKYLQEMRVALRVPTKNSYAALHPQAITAYDDNAFNADFFAPGEEARYTAAKAALGRFLFFDPILSGNNQRACASCHKPEMAFTDGTPRSLNFEMNDLPRNAPTVINSGFQKVQFWDLRATSLEDQLDSVINSPDELHSNFTDVIARINASDEYVQLFHAAFPETKKDGIQRKHVKIAIATYERELTGLNSRFDQYMRGDRSKLNASEISGFNVYMGKAKCGTCHYAPLFSGPLPPYFEYTDHRSIGVPLQDSMKVFQIDIDTGASKVFKTVFTHFSFKVPTVRNVEVTAPYMHNGVFTSLERVVDFYEDGGGVKFEKDMRPGMKGLPFFMILPDKLNLTNPEKADLIAFMKALTDTSASANIPKRLPDIGGKYANLNKRKIGGRY